MITEHDLQEAIAECEGQRNPSANTCLKLAAYYTIKDKMFPDEEKESPAVQPEHSTRGYSYADSPNERSEFRQAIVGMDAERFLSIMDELMTTTKAIVPKLYDGVMRKLTE